MILHHGAFKQTSSHSGRGGHSENIKRKERNESETGERNILYHRRIYVQRWWKVKASKMATNHMHDKEPTATDA